MAKTERIREGGISSMRHVCEERKRHRGGCARSGAEGARIRRRPGLEGASQLAHTSPLERPREGKRGPGTGNLLLYTRPEIRMYHSRTHVGARARAHEAACRWINSHGSDREDDDGKLRTTKVDLRSTGLHLASAHLCQRYRTVSNGSVH